MRLVCFFAALALGCGAAPILAKPDGGAPPMVPDAGDSGVASDAGVPGEVAIDPSCGYAAADNIVLACGGGWGVFHHLEATPPKASCPTLVGAGEGAFASVGTAAAALGCDTACVYTEFQAAQFVYCQARAEYTTLRPGGDGQTGPSSACGELYHYDSIAGGGFYTTMDGFTAAHPCH
jgi:hypothetical protein